MSDDPIPITTTNDNTTTEKPQPEKVFRDDDERYACRVAVDSDLVREIYRLTHEKKL